MKRVIEVTPIATLNVVPTAGFYENNGMLYVASAPSTYPLVVGMLSAVTKEAAGEAHGGGVSEQTLLKAIAIAQRPELAVTLTN